jgi:hypothetical protein
MLVDLDVDPALAFLLVEIACPDDQDEKNIPAHRHVTCWSLDLADEVGQLKFGRRTAAVILFV